MAKKKTGLLVNVLLDRSGSMSGQTDEVINHYNEYVKLLPRGAKVSLSIFDDRYEELYLDTDAAKVPELTSEKYYARGMTALLDSIGKLVTKVKELKSTPDRVLFVINTDGQENSSKEFTYEKIKALVAEVETKGWEFIFVGAGLNNFNDATSSGIHTHVASTNTPAGAAYRYANLTSSTQDFASGLSIEDSATRSRSKLGTEDQYTKAQAKKQKVATPK